MAKRGVNKVIIVGFLGKDPEVRYFQDGSSVAALTVATSEVWRDKQTGEQREKTEWHRIQVFGKLSEIAGEYLRKGSQVYIEGQLETRKYQDNNGQERYSTYVAVRGYTGIMQMLGSRQEQSSNNGPAPHQGQPQSQPQRRSVQRGQQQPPQQQYDEPPMDFDDDIPFAPIGLNCKKLLLSI